MSRTELLSFAATILLSTLCASCGANRGKGTSTATAVSPGTAGGAGSAPTVEVVKIVSERPSVTVSLPGELQPYEVVAIFPKVGGFVEWIGVDRGSRVKSGELIARLVAPEITSERAEAQAKLQSAEAQSIEAEARLAADESTYQRLKTAAASPGVVSGNELELAQKTAEADRARAHALRENVEAAKQALRSLQEVEDYLRVKAPFDGIVTERNIHPGALVGPVGAPGVTLPMVRVEQISRLRLVVPVPEMHVAGIPRGTKVNFTVPAFPGEMFKGVVARVAHSIEVKTRTMPVELDVMNPSGQLSPGMFPEVIWPLKRVKATLFVPSSAVARTAERTFVVRVEGGKVEWVDVKTGITDGGLVEVFGDLREGDLVARRGTDELRAGTSVAPQLIAGSGAGL